MDPLYIIGSLIAVETTYLTYSALRPQAVKTKLKGSIILDTSALIDGRIVSIARSGFISARLIVPASVVRELQYMADKADHDKRERARYGLDVIQTLQSIDTIEIEIYDDGETHAAGVDEQLIVIAKKFGARLCTTDYNLNKVARVESIDVVNVNELAHALRPMHLPGETLTIAIVQQGQGSDQGVGYLDDGTMVLGVQLVILSPLKQFGFFKQKQAVCCLLSALVANNGTNQIKRKNLLLRIKSHKAPDHFIKGLTKIR